MEEISRGWAVFTEDGKRVGDVVEVYPHYLLVSRGLFVVRDLYVPRYAVAAAEDRKVRLAITEDRLRHMGWTAPPPEPPPDVDTSSPRLVPSYESDELDLPPGDAAAPSEATMPDAGEDLSLSYLTDTYAETYAETDDYGAALFDDYADLGITFGPTIEVDEAYLSFRRAGDGPAVVLVHGWGFDRRVWDYVTLDLLQDHSVVTYDARGYGASSAPPHGYDLAQASRDLRVLLRTLELEDATVVAVDVGAAAALHYVLGGGQRAGRLVLIAPAFTAQGDAPGGLPGQVEDWNDALRRDRPRLAAQVAGEWAPQSSPETMAWLRDGLLAAAPHALAAGLQALADADVEGDPGEVTIPVLVLQGRHDPLGDLVRGRQAAEAIPGARFVELDTPGHLPMLADPQGVAAQVRAFGAAQSVTFAEPVESDEAPALAGGSDGDAVPEAGETSATDGPGLPTDDG